MKLLTIYDSASGPVSHPADVDGFMAYAGGNDLHTWTRQQIDQAAQTAPMCYPVWEYGKGRSGEADGLAFHAWLTENRVPVSSLVILSMEASVDNDYIDNFEFHVAHPMALYGSIDTLFANNTWKGTWWPANPTGVPHLFAHEEVIGTQYAWTSLGQTGGYNLDLNLALASVPAWRPLAPLYRALITGGHDSLKQLAASLSINPAEILRITARQSPPAGFRPDVATYIDGCDLLAPMPAGLQLWVPAQ